MQIPYVGELAAFVASLTWSVSVTVYRGYSHKYSPLALNIIKNTIAVSFLILTLLLIRPEFPTSWKVIGMLMISGFFGITIGDTAGFFAIKHLGARVSSTASCMKPVMSTILAYLFLGETLNLVELFGISFTVLMISLVMFTHAKEPKMKVVNQSVAAGVGWMAIGVITDSTGVVLARHAFQETNIWYGTFIRVASSQIGLIAFSCYYKNFKEIGSVLRNPKELKVMFIVGFIGTFIGILLMTVALKYAKTGIASAIMVTYPIWVVPLAHKFLNEKASKLDVIFTILTCLGVVTLVLGKTFG